MVVQHPRLAGDGLDDVVAVGVLRGVEDVEDAARAAAAAHVDRDGGVTEGAARRMPASSDAGFDGE